MSHAVKVGIFVVGGIALFCAGLALIGTKAELFSHRFDVYAQFSDVDSLQPGATVRVGGMNAGQLSTIEIPKGPASKFRLKLQVDEKFRGIVRKDSMVTIETEGMVGNEFVNIAKGSPKSPECPPGCTLPSQEAVSMSALMRQGSNIAENINSTIGDLHQRADTVMQNITSASGHADDLLAKAEPNIVDLTGNANAIAANLRQGKGAAGKLLSDKQVASDVTRTISNARQTSANLVQTSQRANSMIATVEKSDLPAVHQTLDNTQDVTKQMKQAMGTFMSTGNHNENTVVALRNTVHSAEMAANNLAGDTEAIKHNLFLRGFFHRRGFFNLETITPSKYAASRFVKKPRARVWIPAPGLFKAAPDGSQKLTDTGRSIIDQSMSEIVPYLPNNPLVVEGYSTSGMPDAQYRVSRQRAIEVEQYLESRYHLNSKRVGVMPLSDHPPAKTGRKAWDGVCLVLVVSQKQ